MKVEQRVRVSVAIRGYLPIDECPRTECDELHSRVAPIRLGTDRFIKTYEFAANSVTNRAGFLKV